MKEINKQDAEQRKTILVGFVILFFGILVYGFMSLQLTKSEFYTQKSLDNSVRKITTLPVRGLIVDKNNKILVDNNASFSVAVIPKVAADSTIQNLGTFLDIDYQKMKTLIHKQYGYRPVKVAVDIPYEKVIYLEENRLQFPGIITIQDSKRFYREGIYSPHIFGQLGEVTSKEQAVNQIYEQGDVVGKTALERKYDLKLRGSKGVDYVNVDASGRVLGDYDTTKNVSPLHGNDIHLYLDYDMQQFAESLMVDHLGSLVAIDTRSGGVLALVTKPDMIQERFLEE